MRWTLLVLARFGSEIGSNLNRTGPDARFRFGVHAAGAVFEPEPNVNRNPGKMLVLSGILSVSGA
jgi:hypothetical protein